MILDIVQAFSDSVKSKFTSLVSGQPEEQLRAPLATLCESVGQRLGWSVQAIGETALPNRLGRPDYAILVSDLLAGYIELKAPGTGADPTKFKGHDKRQWKRFRNLPNLLYSDGNDWALFRNGERIRVVHFAGDITDSGGGAVTKEDVYRLEKLLRDFFSWEPLVPSRAPLLAASLAPLCRLLHDDVIEGLESGSKPLSRIANEWRDLLFPGATNHAFADAYAQTVTFGLLLARSEGATTLDIEKAVKTLSLHHNLLSRALQLLTDAQLQQDIGASLRLLQRVIDRVPSTAMEKSTTDPWLYFYEDFLSEYDPQLRKDAGAYYTPVEVVGAQVQLVEDLLINKLNKPLGFSEGGVTTLDPAAGTGTYLIAIVDHAMERVQSVEGGGAVPARASLLAQNLIGFELMVGPYSVAELRLTRALTDRGASIGADGPAVFLTNTLESPHTKPKAPPLFHEPIAHEHKRALKIKESTPVLVCIGNPPYDRHAAATEDNRSETGSWVRWGEKIDGSDSIMQDFIAPVQDAGKGLHLKNLYNLYIYFWRWALWKVFEHDLAKGPGVVSYITASSYLDGDAFLGMREHMRSVADDIWIVDLGGEGRGTRPDENVFSIQTPVAIAIVASYGQVHRETPARVRYTRLHGTRSEKLKVLNSVLGFDDFEWTDCANGWQSAFLPGGSGRYFDWPLISDLMPWRHSGVEFKRTWPIAVDQETLKDRWQHLLKANDRATAFRETSDRRISKSYGSTMTAWHSSTPIADLKVDAPHPPIEHYGYRSFDRAFVLADGRLASRPRVELWACQSEKQVYFASLFNHPLGKGPAITCSPYVPDRHYFRGSYGGKDVLPLYRDAGAEQPNVNPHLFDVLSFKYEEDPSAEDVVAYIYGLMCQPHYTELFAEDLETRQLRVPITKDQQLFWEFVKIGRALISLHTWGKRFNDSATALEAFVPKTQCTKPVPFSEAGYPDTYGYEEGSGTLYVGSGEFAPVSQAVWNYEVSGLKVLQSWLASRMKQGKGRKSSPLDPIRTRVWTAERTSELLNLVHLLEKTVALHSKQADLLDSVLSSELFEASDIPPPPGSLVEPPKVKTGQQGLDL